MPQVAAIILLGSLLAFYGNQLPDRLWSAYVPILFLFYRCNPAWRLPLLLAAAWLWSSAILHHHLDHRLLRVWVGGEGPRPRVDAWLDATAVRQAATSAPDPATVVRATVAPGIAMAVRDAEEFVQRWRPWR